jgi:uncharacterized membrane protein
LPDTAAPTSTLRRLAGPFFVFAGVMHFLIPRTYEAIMPPWLPRHRELVLASGAAEIAGGALLLAPDRGLRRAGAWWTVATLLAVFPANLHMALHADEFPKVPRAALYGRLPVQLLFIAWAVAAGRR